MANRHLSRSLVLQTLFEWDFRGLPTKEAISVLHRNVEEFSPGVSEDRFAEKLLESILKKRSTIDSILEKAAPEWPLEKISVVDRNILRIGIYELLFADRGEVPPKVAINEAIEIAKSFGGESSGRFANGVLGAIYKELGEPGKDDKGGRQHGKKKIDKSKLPLETLVGCVVYALHEGDIYLALVHDIFGHWTLAKGHLKGEETKAMAVKRKIQEELGVSDGEVEDELGGNEYVASDPEKGKLLKQVKYFLVRSEYQTLSQGETKGLDDAQWFLLSDVVNLNFYEDVLPIITKAVQILNDRS